jgi:3-oxoacyl-[acyl-carrier-protein] synthase I
MPTLAIKASGMVTAVGFNSPSSCAAIRAGIRGVNESHLWDAESGVHLGVGKVYLPHWWDSLSKLADLVAPAIQECVKAAAPVPGENIPIFLGVSTPTRRARPADLEQHILAELQERFSFRLHPRSEVIARAHISVAIGLQKVARCFSQEQLAFCIVAGVDSLIDQELANFYLSQRRLLTPKNSNGFVLGEAGSAVLVSIASGPESRLEVLGIGVAREKAPIESEEPLRGGGLIEAVGHAIHNAGLSFDDLQYRITDLNGEHYKFKEMVFLMLRCERKVKPKLFDLWHPIEYIGDVGAAIGPIVMGVTLHASEKAYGVGPTVLCTFGNDDGERAAIVARFRS